MNYSFRFKQFSVSHSMSSMKIGVDAVLIGSWGMVKEGSGLDIGCGCGVIALMAAQREPKAYIDALDVHKESVEEAQTNFKRSGWSDRLNPINIDIEEFIKEECNRAKYDFILSNPPFYNCGKEVRNTVREKARHIGSLSPLSLPSISSYLLKSNGVVSLIATAESKADICSKGAAFGLSPISICYVSDRPGKTPKRVMITLKKDNRKLTKYRHELEEQVLYLRTENGEYSSEYKKLTSDFYLYF